MLLSERSESSQRIAKGEPHEISAHKRLISYDVSPLDSQGCDGGPFRGAALVSRFTPFAVGSITPPTAPTNSRAFARLSLSVSSSALSPLLRGSALQMSGATHYELTPLLRRCR